MRWDGLFADLEAQAEALERAERAGEIDEHTRGEVGRLSVRDRLRGAVGLPLRIGFSGGQTVVGRLLRVGPDWLLVQEVSGREAFVALRGVVSVGGLGRHSATPEATGVIESRLGLRHALRGIARDRSTVRIQLAAGPALDGTLDRIGADFADFALHSVGEPRRAAVVRDVLLLPLAAIVVVRRAGVTSV